MTWNYLKNYRLQTALKLTTGPFYRCGSRINKHRSIMNKVFSEKLKNVRDYRTLKHLIPPSRARTNWHVQRHSIYHLPYIATLPKVSLIASIPSRDHVQARPPLSLFLLPPLSLVIRDSREVVETLKKYQPRLFKGPPKLRSSGK